MNVKRTLYYIVIIHMFLVCYGLAVERAIADVTGEVFIRHISNVIVSRVGR